MSDAALSAALRVSPPARARRRTLLIVAVLLAALLLSWKATSYRPLTPGGEPVAVPGEVELIGHAGAGLSDATYSNSLQALDAAAARGFGKVEIDFSLTSDGAVVASHDWDRAYRELRQQASLLPAWLDPAPALGAPTHAEFMGTRMRGGLAPVDLAVLGRWLEQHPHVRIVTDVKGDNVALLRRLIGPRGVPPERLIPQIYARGELAQVRSLGFGDIIYTLYRDPDVPIADVIAFARKQRVAVTLHERRAAPETLAAFRAAGVPVYVHTVNDPERALGFVRSGAAGVYTDFLMHARR